VHLTLLQLAVQLVQQLQVQVVLPHQLVQQLQVQQNN
jgi:hypothetical protein